MNATPPWILAILYWLHMLATVIWIGGLAALALVVLPAARHSLTAETYSTFLLRLDIRLQRLGWLSLGVLVVTGMFQMSAHPRYEGFLAITSPWAGAILIKHAVIGLMVALSAYLTWGLFPALSRAAMLQKAGRVVDSGQLERLKRREIWLLRVNLLAAVVVLLLTAWARAS